MRRSWLFAAAALAVSALALPASALGAGADFTHGVASGDVTSNGAILWTRAVPEAPVGPIKLEVWKESDCLVGQKAFQRNLTPSAARDFTIKVDATGLEPGTGYCFRFRRGEEAFSPVGHLKTAPGATTPADVTLTYSGDQDSTGTFATPCCGTFDVLAQALGSGSDFYVPNGDNIYSDSSHRTSGPATTLAEYRQAYKDALTFPNLLNLRAGMSQYALMDDHEVVNDYDGLTVDPARYAAGRQAFLDYHPVRESGLPHDPSCAGDPLYRNYKWGSDVEVFVLDLRSCRSGDVAVNPCLGDLGPTLPESVRTQSPFNIFLAPTPPPGCLSAIFDPSRTVLGPVQKAKFKNDLMSSDATFKFVVNEYAIQQYHALPYDRWEGYGAERNEILDFISNNGIDNVVFLTTDHHATIQNEVFKDRFTAPGTVAYDFVTGPVGTNTLREEIIGQFGTIAFAVFNVVLDIDAINCRNLDLESFGEVSFATATQQATFASRDATGATVTDTATTAPCAGTLP